VSDLLILDSCVAVSGFIYTRLLVRDSASLTTKVLECARGVSIRGSGYHEVSNSENCVLSGTLFDVSLQLVRLEPTLQTANIFCGFRAGVGYSMVGDLELALDVAHDVPKVKDNHGNHTQPVPAAVGPSCVVNNLYF
jgi:hypothetical protein